jgi:hypothetical protein
MNPTAVTEVPPIILTNERAEVADNW